MKSKKIALITGAGRGIGAAIAKRLASEGFFVIINYNKSSSSAEKVLKGIKNRGGEGELLQGDVSRSSDVQNIGNKIKKKFGKLDLIINNAEVAYYKDFENTTIDELKKTFNVNVYGAFYVLNTMIDLLKKSESPMIINITSGAAVDSWPGFRVVSGDGVRSTPMTAYIASKYAMRGFLRALSNEYPKIKMVNFAPALVSTDMTREEFSDIKRDYFYSPDDVAEMILNIVIGKIEVKSGDDFVMPRKDIERFK